MAVPIKNATTEVAVERTVGEIMGLLRGMGARAVAVRYDSGDAPSGIGFELATDHGPRQFELPVQIDGVLSVLTARDSGVPPRFRVRHHAERVAWRIAKDWLAAQVAIIAARQVTTVQVMLPYLVTDRDASGTAVTVYDQYVAREGRLALEGGTT